VFPTSNKKALAVMANARAFKKKLLENKNNEISVSVET
jgi:hypothetical protein